MYFIYLIITGDINFNKVGNIRKKTKLRKFV